MAHTPAHAMKRRPEEILALKKRTRVITVLTSLELTVMTLRSVLEGQTPALEQLAAITDGIDACMKELGVGRGRLSAGMLRECDQIANKLDHIRLAHTGGRGVHSPETMGAWLWCLDALLTDARALERLHSQCWQDLAREWETFASAWDKVVRDHNPEDRPDEAGMAMYMECTDAAFPGGSGLV